MQVSAMLLSFSYNFLFYTMFVSLCFEFVLVTSGICIITVTARCVQLHFFRLQLFTRDYEMNEWGRGVMEKEAKGKPSMLWTKHGLIPEA